MWPALRAVKSSIRKNRGLLIAKCENFRSQLAAMHDATEDAIGRCVDGA